MKKYRMSLSGRILMAIDKPGMLMTAFFENWPDFWQKIRQESRNEYKAVWGFAIRRKEKNKRL